MKNQVLFSSKDKSTNLKCPLLQFLFGTLTVKTSTIPLKLIHVKTGNPKWQLPIFRVNTLIWTENNFSNISKFDITVQISNKPTRSKFLFLTYIVKIFLIFLRAGQPIPTFYGSIISMKRCSAIRRSINLRASRFYLDILVCCK